MNKFLTLFLAVLFLATSAYSLPKRNIVIEDHTGAWCGWCVLGIQAMEDMHAEYGDRVIPLGVHNGDGMTRPIQAELANIFGITGYPSGVINREQQTVDGTTAYDVHPIYWKDLVPTLIDQTSPVEVMMTFNLNKAAKTLTAELTATFYEDYNGELRWNFVIVEDGQTGSGSQWDQSNYLSGDPTYSDHPFFELPSSIKGFVHKNVVLDYLGGAQGDPTEMPANIKSGSTYKKTYTVNLATMSNIQNIDNLWFAGWLQEASTRKILNSVSANKKPTKASIAAKISSSELLVTGERNSTMKNTFTIANPSSLAIDVTLSMDETNSILPNGWTYEFSKTTFTLPGKGSVNIDLTTTTSSSAGCANYTILSKVKSTNDYDGLSSKLEVFNMSDGIKYAILKPEGQDGESFKHFRNQISTMEPFNSSMGIMPYNLNTFQLIDISGFSMIIYPEDWSSQMSMINNTYNLGSKLYGFVNWGKPALIISPFNLFFVAGNYPSIPPPFDIENFFKNGLFISGAPQTYDGRWLYDNDTKKYVTIDIKGKDGESITQGLNFKINETWGENEFQTGWVEMIKILDNNKVKEILTYDNPRIPKETSTAAVKIEYEKVKVIYQGFGFDAMKNWGQSRTLLANYMTWLTGTTGVEPGDLNPSNLNVYPNPSVSYSEISITPSKEESNADISIFDNNGKKIETIHKGYLPAEKASFKLNCSSFPNGSYHIIANLNGMYSYQQLIISR